jgi:hypothetical protein
MSYDVVTWVGIAACLSQSGMFSGLNLALFGVSRLRLEVQAANGDGMASRVLALRKDANFVLTTILWGNVGANVLLTLLSDSVLAGVSAFVFSTLVITCVGEIIPQAYFSRHALKMANLLAPVLRLYQIILYPIAKPTAKLLDLWLGKESIKYLPEAEISEVIRQHVASVDSDVDQVEGLGAMNFLALDDLLVSQVGEPVAPESVVRLSVQAGRPVFPDFRRSPDDPLLQQIHAAGVKWVILTSSPEAEPLLVLDADGFLRAALFENTPCNPYAYCHRPILVRDQKTPLGKVITQLKVQPEHAQDDVIDQDIIVVWDDEKRLITGADILGRLLRGIVGREPLSE